MMALVRYYLIENEVDRGLLLVNTALLKDFCIVLCFENTEAFEYNFNKYFTPLLLAGKVHLF